MTYEQLKQEAKLRTSQQSLIVPYALRTKPDFFSSHEHGKMIQVALLTLELARERLAEVTKFLTNKRGIQQELTGMAKIWLTDWKSAL